MTIKLTLIFILTFFFTKIVAQDKNARLAEHEEKMKKYRQKYSEEYKTTIIDSLDFVGELVDINFGVSCGTQIGAGLFVFKVKTSNSKTIKDTIGVVIQCALGRYESILLKGFYYKVRTTPNKLKQWADISWYKYPSIDRYFLVNEKAITKAD